jgi:hypothetical protein
MQRVRAFEVLLKKEDAARGLVPRDTESHGSACLILPVILVCYHAATRTGQPSAILAHVRALLVCGFLWV